MSLFSSPWRAATLVAVVALTLQSIYLIESRTDPSFTVPVVDAEAYHEAAVNFATKERAADRPFWQPPLFPTVLGGLYALAGPSVLAARLGLAVMGTASCVLVWSLGRRVFSPRVGSIAGCILAAYGPFILFSTQLLPVGLAVFLDLLTLNLLMWAHDRPHWLRWLSFGVCAGLAIITVPNAGVILIIGLIWLAATGIRKRAWRNPVLHGIAALIGATAAIAPVTIRNYAVSGEFVLISTNGGVNFFIGNNPEADRTVAVRPGQKWERLTRAALVDGPKTPAQQDVYFYTRVSAYIREDPAGFLGGLLRKVIRILNACEIPRNVDLYVHRSFSRLASLLMWRAGPAAFPFGLVAPLAAVGIVATLGSNRSATKSRAPAGVLLLFIILYGGSVVLFFVTARYRIPLVPAVSTFAAAGVVWIWEQVRGRAERTPSRVRWLAGLAFLAVGIAANRSMVSPTDPVDFRAELYMNVGNSEMMAGRLEKAESHLGEALKYDPGYARAYCKLAQVLFWKGQREESQRHLRRAIELDPDDTESYWLLAALLLEEGKAVEALRLLEQALVADPLCPKVHVGLADTLLAMGRIDEAITHFRRADRVDAQPGDVLIRFADALVARGQYAEGLECYDRALAQTEPDPQTLNRIARLLAMCPQPELRDCRRAIELAEHLCQMTDYQHPVALDTLAAAYAECGRLAEAKRMVLSALELLTQEDDTGLRETLERRLAACEQP